MTLPVAPDVETILDSCIETLRDVVAPSVEGDWPRYNAELMVGSLEYVKHLLREDIDASRREELSRALDQVKEIVAADPAPEWAEALQEESPFEAASRLLVACQNSGGEVAERIRATLHPVLHAQIDAEMARTMGLFSAFARNMVGAK
ncbi:MAG: hypothetical protein GY723_19285 [bacterium]|nr:hypothetical protein [bacterium]MCP5068864.1 hypothetical protein [bacterium]